MNETINIERFNLGTIANPDSENIPLESASDSLNIDGDLADGRLRAIPTNGAAYTANGTAITDVRLGAFIEDNGVYDLIYHDSSDNHITAIKNFYAVEASRTLEDLVTSNVSDNSVIIPNNREVHVGTGNGSANVPKWIGRADHVMFGGETLNDVFSGSGLDDATGSLAAYSGTTNVTFQIIIDATGTPDTFTWSKNGGTATTGVAITGGAQTLSDGVTITFAATTGHTIADKWYLTKYVATGDLIVEDAECVIGAITIPLTINRYNIGVAATAGTGTKYFKTTKIYSWGLSLIYDGYQESPVRELEGATTPGADAEYYTVTITAGGAGALAYQFNKRVTGMKLYRRESSDLSTNNYGLWRLVYAVDAGETTWAPSGLDLILAIIDYGTSAKIGDDIQNRNPSYEEETGMPEELTGTIVNYSLACSGNGYLFVGRCYHSEIEEASQFVFHSKSKRFDMFDWSKDLLRLPRVPTAMVFYIGRLFVFDTNNIYVVNPDLMVIEDTFVGAGALGQRSVLATVYGIFFANKENAFYYDGSLVAPIGDNIKQSASGGRSWKTLSYTAMTDIIVLYMTKRGNGESTPVKFGSEYILFINDIDSTGAKSLCWAYHRAKERWDPWDLGSIAVDVNSGAFIGKDGEIYFSNASQTVELLAGTSRQNFEWYSQEITMGDPSQDKKWYHLITDATGAGTVTSTFAIEGGSYASLTSTTEIKTGGAWTKAKTLKMKLVTSGVKTIDSISVIVRRMLGKRTYV